MLSLPAHYVLLAGKGSVVLFVHWIYKEQTTDSLLQCTFDVYIRKMSPTDAKPQDGIKLCAVRL